MKEGFARFARRISVLAGSPTAFLLALLLLVGWAVSGPLAHFSDTWQLIINTGTTIVTFLMVFLIQNSQNREAKATQLKLDELIRAVERASNRVINIEDASEEELDRLHARFQRLHARFSRVMDPDAGVASDAAEAEVPFAAEVHTAERVRRTRNGRWHEQDAAP
jgi:low affinity Fe/Cu permease